MRTVPLIILPLLLGLAAAPEPLQDRQQTQTTQQDKEVVTEPSFPQRIPAEAKRRKNPFPGDLDSIRHGEELFVTQCTMCHGVRGDGEGDLVGRLGLQVPDFTDPSVQRGRTDGELFYILTVGHGGMPGEGDRIPDPWKWDLVNYVRTLAR